jgi:TetR/AcrR family transcriptional regulator, lmrAB and yxaGH operons repressor
MPAAVISRDDAVERILDVFRRYGYEGASLARLSEATGLGRSSLYHHFPNGKEDMATAAMAAVSAWFGDNVLSELDSNAAPKEKLRRFAGKLTTFYEKGAHSCLTDVFTIGEAGTLFQPHVRKRVQTMIQHLAAVIEEAGVAPAEAARRAENAVIGIQGSLVIARALGSNSPFLRAMKELPDKLLKK